MHTKLVTLIAVMCVMGITVFAEAMPIIMDQCNQTSGDGMGHSCPGPNDLLIRLKYADGFCGDWICCPPNPGGQTYDCAHATNPTSIVKGLKGFVLPDRNLTIDPGTGQATVKQPFIPGGSKGGILRRGIEGEQPAPAGQEEKAPAPK
jgi:hypothetical protein